MTECFGYGASQVPRAGQIGSALMYCGSDAGPNRSCLLGVFICSSDRIHIGDTGYESLQLLAGII